MTNNTKKTYVKYVVFLAIYILLLIGATASMLESSGIFRTLPLIFILPAVASIFYNKKRLTALLCFGLVLLFLLVESGSVKYAALQALIAFAFACIGIFIKRLVVTFFADSGKRVFVAILALILFAGSLFSYAFLFGNPAAQLAAHQKNISYLKESYASAAPNIGYTYYNFDEKAYLTKVSFDEDVIMSAEICAKDEENVIDGYNNYYEYKYLSARSNILKTLLELKLPDETRAVRINIDETKITCAAIKDPDALCTEMVFDIAFYSQLNTKEEFLEKCKEYYAVIEENGFVYGKINFYGGFADEFIFEMTVEYGAENLLSELVKDFSAENFERYYSDEDLYDHWSYND